MKILIFTEGTVTMQSTAIGVDREERVKQSVGNISSVNDFRDYIPNGGAVDKLDNWKSQGAEIFYLTSRTLPNEIDDVRFVLDKYHFPDPQNLLYRKEAQEYKDVAENLLPDILIEDDCESIGGESEMTYPHIRPDPRRKIKSIVIKEFAGIDGLPENLDDLKRYDTN
jgi:hypothetical protein